MKDVWDRRIINDNHSTNVTTQSAKIFYIVSYRDGMKKTFDEQQKRCYRCKKYKILERVALERPGWDQVDRRRDLHTKSMSTLVRFISYSMERKKLLWPDSLWTKHIQINSQRVEETHRHAAVLPRRPGEEKRRDERKVYLRKERSTFRSLLDELDRRFQREQ